MNIEIIHGPGNAAAKITMGAGERCTAESGAMIAMSGDMGITTTTHKRGKGSIMKSVKRLLSGESFFLNHFQASDKGGELYLATTLSGDMMQYNLDNENLIVQGGSYVSCEEGIEIDLGWEGFKSFLSGESILHELSPTSRFASNADIGLFRHYKLGRWRGWCRCVLVDDQSPAGIVLAVNIGAVKGWRRWRIGWRGQDGFLYLVDSDIIRFNPAQVCDRQ